MSKDLTAPDPMPSPKRGRLLPAEKIDLRLYIDAREYVDVRLADADLRYQQRYVAQQEALNAALAAAEKAVIKAEGAAEKRFDSVNEFRGQLADQAMTFMPRKESEVASAALAEKVERLERTQAAVYARGSGMKDSWGYLLGAVGLFAGIAGVVFALAGH